MSAKGVVIGTLALALLGGGPAFAQVSDQDKAKDKAKQEQQLREAERQMREAERQMRDAQRQLEEAARQMARLRADQARETVRTHTVWFGSKPRLGVVVNTVADPVNDKVGAVLKAVTPGGPADEAGLRAGDIVVKLNGEPLAGASDEADEDESGPGVRLIDLASDLEEGEPVAVEYRRGNETRTATIIPRPLGPKAMKVITEPRVRVKVGDIDKFEVATPDFDIGDIEVPGVDVRVFNLPGSWLDMELAPLDQDLGGYFGTKDGVLVVRAPKESALGLKSGDVILKIGDREATSPSQALRVLRSYDPGEKVALDVVRQKQKVTLSAVMPERKHGHWVEAPPPPEPPPAWPEPPKAPKAPKPPKGASSSDSL